MLNILLAGVGGQGTVLASKIIARCSINRGEPAHTAETIGMAQRGGCVVSHVRTGTDVYSPLIPVGYADVIIGFEPAEAVRSLSYLKEGGTVIVNSAAVKPVTDSLSDTEYNGAEMLDYLRQQDIKLVIVDGDKIVEDCGSPKVLNIALLGAAAKSGAIGVTIEEIENVIQQTLAKKFCDINIKALTLGSQQV